MATPLPPRTQQFPCARWHAVRGRVASGSLPPLKPGLAFVRPPMWTSLMARILLHSLVFAPDGVSTAVLMSELAVELAGRGHTVTVLTTTPHYNVDEDARSRQPLQRAWGGFVYYSEYRGIPVLHVRVAAGRRRIASRLWAYLCFHVVSTLVGCLSPARWDVILVPSPPLTIGLTAWLIALRHRVPFLYNVQEIYPDVAVSLGVLRNGSLIKLLEWVEAFVYARSSVIVTISESFRQRLLDKRVPSAKLAVIPNFVDTDFVAPGARHNEFSARYGFHNSFVLLYAGNIGLTQGFETLLDAVERLRDLDHLRVLLVGDGARRPWLEDQLAHRGAQRVILLPYQPRSVVPQLYASSDLCIIPMKAGTAHGTFPSKVYTIMAAGRPVVVAAEADSELAWVVRDANCGWVVDPDDPAAFACAIARAHADPNGLHDRGVRGREYVVANHSRQAIGQRYAALISQVCARADGTARRR